MVSDSRPPHPRPDHAHQHAIDGARRPWKVIGRLLVAAAVVSGLGLLASVVMFPSGFGPWTAFLLGTWLSILGALSYVLLEVRTDPAMAPSVRTFLIGGLVTTALVIGSSVIMSGPGDPSDVRTAEAPTTTAVHHDDDDDDDDDDGDGEAPDVEAGRERPERPQGPRSVVASIEREPEEQHDDDEPVETTADDGRLVGPAEPAGDGDGDRSDPVAVSSRPVPADDAPGRPGDDRRPRVSTTVPAPRGDAGGGPPSPPAPGTSPPGTLAPTPPAPSVTPAPSTATVPPRPVTVPPSPVTVPQTTPSPTRPPTPAPTSPPTPAPTSPPTPAPTTPPATTTPATLPPPPPPSTQAPTTQPVTTQAPTTQAPTTQAPTTQAPTTQPAAPEPKPDRPKPNLPDHVPPHAGPKPQPDTSD